MPDHAAPAARTADHSVPPPLPAPSNVLVVTDQPYFASPVARHFVSVLDGEGDTRRLFFRKPANPAHRARHVVASDDGPGRYFTCETLESHQSSMRMGVADELPETHHESFGAFLEAIGYDWRSNSYDAPAALAKAA